MSFNFKENCSFTFRLTIQNDLIVIVIVLKSNDSVRIWGDHTAKINTYAEKEKSSLPRNEELFGELSGLKFFTLFDLKDAYFQQSIGDKTSKIWTINIYRG